MYSNTVANEILSTTHINIFYTCAIIESVDWECEFGDWNDGMEWWSGLLEWRTGLDYWSATPIILHNLSMYSCMEVTVKLSLCLLWSHPMQAEAVTKITR